MYCVIGEKILRCEVSEKLENYSWVRIGKTEKGQTIPNNRIFETEDAAKQFIQRRETRKSAKDKDLLDEIAACKSAYDDFQEETGISVRIIDRLFKVNEVEKQLAHLRKKYNKSEEAQSAGAKTPKDSRQFSKKPSSSFRSRSEDDKKAPYGSKDRLGNPFQDRKKASSQDNGSNTRTHEKRNENRGRSQEAKPYGKKSENQGRSQDTKSYGKQNTKSTARKYK